MERGPLRPAKREQRDRPGLEAAGSLGVQPGAGAALEGGQEGHKRLSAYDQRG